MDIAAADAAVHPSPPSPARRTVASLACTHLSWIAVDAVFCLLLASLWLFFWGLATRDFAKLTCGMGSAVFIVAHKVFCVAGVTFAVVLPVSLQLARTKSHAKAVAVVPVAAAAADIEATEMPAPKTSITAMLDALRDLRRDLVFLWVLASMAFGLLMGIAALAHGEDSPVMATRRGRICVVMYMSGELCMNMVNCFVLCPLITARIWRNWKKARHAL